MTKELIYMFKEFEEKYTKSYPVNSADQIDLPTFFDFTNLLLRTKDMVASNFWEKKKTFSLSHANKPISSQSKRETLWVHVAVHFKL